MVTCSVNTRERSDTQTRSQLNPQDSRLWGSYLAGQFAGAQAVLHGQRLRHVRNRLVDLLQVAFVLHLDGVLSKTGDILKQRNKQKKTQTKKVEKLQMCDVGARTSLASVLASFNVL